jgi:hypothetical protein
MILRENQEEERDHMIRRGINRPHNEEVYDIDEENLPRARMLNIDLHPINQFESNSITIMLTSRFRRN